MPERAISFFPLSSSAYAGPAAGKTRLPDEVTFTVVPGHFLNRWQHGPAIEQGGCWSDRFRRETTKRLASSTAGTAICVWPRSDSVRPPPDRGCASVVRIDRSVIFLAKPRRASPKPSPRSEAVPGNAGQRALTGRYNPSPEHPTAGGNLLAPPLPLSRRWIDRKSACAPPPCRLAASKTSGWRSDTLPSRDTSRVCEGGRAGKARRHDPIMDFAGPARLPQKKPCASFSRTCRSPLCRPDSRIARA